MGARYCHSEGGEAVTDDLIERLRHGVGDAVRDHNLMAEAADRIAALEAERDRLKAAFDEVYESNKRISALRAERDRLRVLLAKAANQLDYAAGIISIDAARDRVGGWADEIRAALNPEPGE